MSYTLVQASRRRSASLTALAISLTSFSEYEARKYNGLIVAIEFCWTRRRNGDRARNQDGSRELILYDDRPSIFLTKKTHTYRFRCTNTMTRNSTRNARRARR